jgi:hypothetical protein
MGPQVNLTGKKGEASLWKCLDAAGAVKEAESSLRTYLNETDAEKEAGLMQNLGQE